MLNKIFVFIIATAIFSLFQLGGIVPSLSDKALDILFLLRGPVRPNQEIIIVAVDEESLSALGAWPFPRKYHAELLGRLKEAKVIGFDILFSEPTEQDQLFNAAIRSSPPVILASAHSFQHRVLHPSSSLSGYFGTGHIETLLGRDGKVREVEIFRHSGRHTEPALAMVMLKAAGIEKKPAAPGKPMLINHYGPENTFLHLSYSDVLRGKIPEFFFKDRFVLVGVEALGVGDSHRTPFSSQHPTPGVEIQATILNNLLDNSLLQPLPTVSWFLVAGVGILSLFVWPARAEKWNLAINISLASLLILGSVVLFHRFLFLNPAPPLFFLTLTFLVHLVAERLRTAKILFKEISGIDHQLKTQLEQMYTNTPTRFFNLQTPSAGGIRHHLSHLETGVKILSLQQHFIENILKEELPPIILWDRHSGLVILANTMFNVFWTKHASKKSELPELDQFIRLLEEKQPSKAEVRFDVDTLFDDDAIPAIDIGLNRHGRKEYFRVNIHPFEVADIEFSGVLAIITDVTEIKELEQLKGDIISIVAHELRLPLTVILGYGEILTEKLALPEKRYAAKICSQTRRLNRLIESFLDVARLEQGRREIKKLPLDLARLIHEAVQTVSVPAEKKSIELIQQTPHRATPILGDSTLLLQAVINLLDNAIKFSPTNTQITIELIEESDRFILSVADQGPGVPAGSREEIFDKFNRGKRGSIKDGFGLGLNFVKQVVQKHGGELWLEPEKGCGATFCIKLAKNGNK